MLKSITLENFFSFGPPTKIELNPDVNVLVGINGSGKSNFMKAIRLLYEGIIGDGMEKLFLRDWGGFGNVANYGVVKNFVRLKYVFEFELPRTILDGITYNFEYEILLFGSGNTRYYLEEKVFGNYSDKPSLKALLKTGDLKIFLREGGDQGQLVDYSRMSEINSAELILRQISDPARYPLIFTFRKYVESIALYDYFDTTLKSEIRQPSSFDTNYKLAHSGDNLLTILSKIQRTATKEYDQIVSLLRNINPNFKDFSFQLFGHKQMLYLRERSLSKAISIEHISDGTLNFLLLLAILYNPNRGKLVCIDEPEKGLHPDMTKTIADALKFAAKTSQIIIATHSPLLLNAFDLDEVLIFEKDKDNQSIVEVKSEEDFEGDFLVGQLWLNGQIGGKRW